MAQRLIVEGNDGIALAVLCRKRRLPLPLGYEPENFKKFVINSGGYTKALFVLKESLDDPTLTNIGIIVDANDVGASARWQTIRRILAEKYAETSLLQADQQIGSKIVQEENLPKIGVWIMPDNQSAGYLEHFLAGLIPENDSLWIHATDTVKNLQQENFNELTSAKIGKAYLHTWLAWKREPGKPFGQAVDADYFDANAASVQPFLDWFRLTFILNAL